MTTRSPLLPLIALVAGLAGCDDMATEPSMLDAPRFLAVRATPPALAPAADVTLEALTWEIDTVRWDACPTPWAPTSPLSCAAGAVPLGVGNPITFTPPDGLAQLWIKAEADGAPDVLPMIATLATDGPAANPTILGVAPAEGALPAAVAPGATLPLRALLGPATPVPDGADPRRVVSFYTSAGAFDPYRTFDDGETALLAPDAPTTAELRVVVRDAAGGTGWYATTIAVEAP